MAVCRAVLVKWTLFPNWGKAQSTETSRKLKGLFHATDGDGSSSALLSLLGFITEAVTVPSHAGSTLCAPDISDQEPCACQGQTQRGSSVPL